MGGSRLVYQNWIVDLGRDPGRLSAEGSAHIGTENQDSSGPSCENENTGLLKTEISRSVSEALSVLTESEREFVERFYLMGESYRTIAQLSGRAIHRLEAMHKRAIRRLRSELSEFVLEKFAIESKPVTDCIVCRSIHRDKIDRIIASRDPEGTWRPIIGQLKSDFDITIKTPQILIGHEKYH
ncbi:MAG: hypothetical protein V3T31_04030 [candidate division Zixibacteria bacterium]